jgi:hypothetical protein
MKDHNHLVALMTVLATMTAFLLVSALPQGSAQQKASSPARHQASFRQARTPLS